MGASVKNLTFLALDPATVTGWCIGSPNSTPRLGTLDLTKPKEIRRGYAFEVFRRWLLRTFDEREITHVIFESPVLTKFTNIHMTRMAQGLDAHIEAAVETWNNDNPDQRIALSEATPGQMKKILTGKGNAPKAAMMKHAIARGMSPDNDNEADAFAAWLYLLGEIEPDEVARFDPINFGRLTT